MTILKSVWRSPRAGAPWCAHFPADICSVIEDSVMIVEKCAHRDESGVPHVGTLKFSRKFDELIAKFYKLSEFRLFCHLFLTSLGVVIKSHVGI